MNLKCKQFVIYNVYVCVYIHLAKSDTFTCTFRVQLIVMST